MILITLLVDDDVWAVLWVVELRGFFEFVFGGGIGGGDDEEEEEEEEELLVM